MSYYLINYCPHINFHNSKKIQFALQSYNLKLTTFDNTQNISQKKRRQHIASLLLLHNYYSSAVRVDSISSIVGN